MIKYSKCPKSLLGGILATSRLRRLVVKILEQNYFFELFLNLQKIYYRLDKTILMFADGASWHTSVILIVPENISLLKLPPHSPNLNPVENIWHELREKWFYNLYFASLDLVETKLMEALASLENNPTRLKSATAFNWIISAI